MKRITAGEVPKIRASEATDGTDETLATLGVSSLSSTELGIEQPKECHGTQNHW